MISQDAAPAKQDRAPLLSVVVPYYNVEAYIEACLESIRDQLLADIEVILVDDGSLDGSVKIAERFVAEDPRFRLIRQENQGLGPARNTGTRHARGKYLTFVDSDDLVAPRAYTHLVGSLEQSGSDFATGNTYRFARNKVKQSWTHRDLFHQTRIATTLGAFPALVADRMIWNKVYRRSFWDAGGYEFPPIRYEDYPVTFHAYLEARAIDVIGHHVYFWRDRESGDSISQKNADRENVTDRTASALQVLQVLAEHPETHPEVEHRLHSYFVQVDLITLAEAMASATPADRPYIVADAQALADRLNPEWADLAPPLARMIHKALQRRQLALVTDLASWRLTGDTRTLVKQLVRSGGPHIIPAVMRAITRRRQARNPFRSRRLRVRATNVSWTPTTLELDLTVTLRRQLAQLSQVSVVLPAPGGEIELAVQRVGSNQIQASIPLAELERRDRDLMGNFRVDLRIGPLHWRGLVSFNEQMLPGCALAGRRWVQPRGVGSYLGVEVKRSATVVESVTVQPDGRISLFVAEPIPAVANDTMVVEFDEDTGLEGLDPAEPTELEAEPGTEPAADYEAAQAYEGESAQAGDELDDDGAGEVGLAEIATDFTARQPEVLMLALQRPDPPGAAVLGSIDAPIETDFATLIAGDVVDNIVTRTSFRTFVVPRERSEEEVDAIRRAARSGALSARQRAAKRYGTQVFDHPLHIVEPDPIDRRPVWWAGSQASIPLDTEGRVLTRNWHGGFGLHTSAPPDA